ncbi:unnamed protein product [Prorocentrum cordatum]|uniref:Uncharacterized protein n=1 Tax=Prorocentrum cordatum TaxID=2364126 RepID=A0ABN9QDP2_9DINO|nr:unnamed protein product [Polarella glacialis]
MALLGLGVSFVTRVGDDADGRWARNHYEALGMDTSRCLVVPGALTTSACVVVERETSRRTCLIHCDRALFASPAAQAAPIDWRGIGAVNTDGHDPALALPIVRAAAAAGLRIFSDMEVCDCDRRELASLATDLVAPARILRELAGQGTIRHKGGGVGIGQCEPRPHGGRHGRCAGLRGREARGPRCLRCVRPQLRRQGHHRRRGRIRRRAEGGNRPRVSKQKTRRRCS